MLDPSCVRRSIMNGLHRPDHLNVALGGDRCGAAKWLAGGGWRVGLHEDPKHALSAHVRFNESKTMLVFLNLNDDITMSPHQLKHHVCAHNTFQLLILHGATQR